MMQELYLLTEYVNNNGGYEDLWHGARVVGVYSSFESAMQIVNKFKQEAIAFCETMASDGENFKFLELNCDGHIAFAAAWRIDTGHDIDTTIFHYLIEKTTIDNYNSRFILPHWLVGYKEEE